MEKERTIEIEKIYADNEICDILHHIGFKGIVKHKNGEIVAASSNCSDMVKLAKEKGDDYEYKESY